MNFERHFSYLIQTLLNSIFGLAIIPLTKHFYPPERENWYELTEVQLSLPHLDPAFDGFRMVQISDFHLGTWLNRAKLREVVERVNRLHPDLIAITGDFVNLEPEGHVSDMREQLSRLRAPEGVVAVLGNHDHWLNPGLVRQVLRDSQVIELPNTFMTIHKMGASLHIAGVDDYMVGKADLDQVLKRLPEDGAAILLAHEPDFADISAASQRFDLQISGHTHGGEILLPFVGPPYLPSFGRKYISGLYEIGGMYQYTNRGLGTSELQIRVNCEPEITLFRFQSGRSAR